MTISPPAKVKNVFLDVFPVLASGVDSLDLAIDVFWKDDSFFSVLAELKEQAITIGEEYPGSLRIDDNDEWKFNMKPFGTNGYEWLLISREYTLKIGNRKVPNSRPSILVEIRSETLWCLGPDEAVSRIIDLLLAHGGSQLTVKPSRIDLCADLLLPVAIWSTEIIKDMVCRADNKGLYFYKKQLSGISIGKGKISARLYDKPLEIRTKSHKDWMHDIWNLYDIPKDKRVIRVEYQMRREMIVEIGVKRFHDLLKFQENLWAYCTQNWLKFQTNTDKHHTQRKTLPWWLSVQSGFQGVQMPTPLIRGKAFNRDLQMYNSQAMGALSSLAATHMEMNNEEVREDMDLQDCFGALYDAGDMAKKRGLDFGEVVKRKRAKHARKEQAFVEVLEKRRGQGFPSGL